MLASSLVYKGYKGTVTFDKGSSCYWGRIVGIKDLVSYESKEIGGILIAFKEAVEDYINFCIEVGKPLNKKAC